MGAIVGVVITLILLIVLIIGFLFLRYVICNRCTVTGFSPICDLISYLMPDIIVTALSPHKSLGSNPTCPPMGDVKVTVLSPIRIEALNGFLYVGQFELDTSHQSVIISPDESRGYIGFRSVAPPPPPPPPP